MKAKHFNSVSAEYKAPSDDPVEAANPEPAEMAQLRIRVIALENIVITYELASMPGICGA